MTSNRYFGDHWNNLIAWAAGIWPGPFEDGRADDCDRYQTWWPYQARHQNHGPIDDYLVGDGVQSYADPSFTAERHNVESEVALDVQHDYANVGFGDAPIDGRVGRARGYEGDGRFRRDSAHLFVTGSREAAQRAGIMRMNVLSLEEVAIALHRRATYRWAFLGESEQDVDRARLARDLYRLRVMQRRMEDGRRALPRVG